MTTPNMSKVALDSVATDYWTKYFGPYGRQWVRDIPKKVKAHVAGLNKSAAAEIADDRAYPVRAIAHTINDDGVTLEGAVRTADRDLLFRCEFSHDGQVRSFETV